MRLKFVFISILLCTSSASADESSVYLCSLENKPSDVVVRLKKYFDAKENLELGKIDRIHNAEVLESSKAKVYQIPIYQEDYYLQIWYGVEVSVDAQLNYNQGYSAFPAIYKKKNEKLDIICYQSRD